MENSLKVIDLNLLKRAETTESKTPQRKTLEKPQSLKMLLIELTKIHRT